MKLGLIGALGGIGAGLEGQAKSMRADIAAREEEQRTLTRAQVLAEIQDAFAIRREGREDTRQQASEDRQDKRTQATEKRTDLRSEEAKDRDYTRLQTEAPGRRSVKAADTTSELDTKLDHTTRNRETIAANTKSETEAKQTDADRNYKNAAAENQSATAEYTRDVKPSVEAGRNAARGGDGGTSKVFQERVKSINDQIERQEQKWSDWLGDGTVKYQIDPETKKRVLGTPEQRLVQKNLAVLKEQRDRLLAEQNSSPAATAAPLDPLNLDKPRDNREGGAAPKPGMIGPTNKAESRMAAAAGDPMGANVVQIENDLMQARQELPKVREPLGRQQLQEYIAKQEQTLARLKALGPEKPAAAPAAVPAPATTPPAALRVGLPETDSIEGTIKALNGLELPSMKSWMTDPTAREAYLSTKEALRQRLALQTQQREARAANPRSVN